MIKIIAAHDADGVVGYQGKIPWYIPRDMQLFKERTTGQSVIMGRKTWESLPDTFRPLPNRRNIVVSKKYATNSDEFMKWFTSKVVPTDFVYSFSSLKESVNLASKLSKDIFLIGGMQIWQEALDLDIVDEILISLIDGKHDGDVFFPKLTGDWRCASIVKHDGFSEVCYKRGTKNVV